MGVAVIGRATRLRRPRLNDGLWLDFVVAAGWVLATLWIFSEPFTSPASVNSFAGVTLAAAILLLSRGVRIPLGGLRGAPRIGKAVRLLWLVLMLAAWLPAAVNGSYGAPPILAFVVLAATFAVGRAVELVWNPEEFPARRTDWWALALVPAAPVLFAAVVAVAPPDEARFRFSQGALTAFAEDVIEGGVVEDDPGRVGLYWFNQVTVSGGCVELRVEDGPLADDGPRSDDGGLLYCPEGAFLDHEARSYTTLVALGGGWCLWTRSTAV